MTPQKKVIINADDFGITKAVSDAIIEVYKSGAITSTTLMVNMPAAAYAAEHAKGHPGLGIGLHFNITEGQPLTIDNSVLQEKGGWQNPRHVLFKQIILGNIRIEEIRQELEAQYAYAKQLGVNPTHVDSHQHIHMFPPVFKLICEFCRVHNLPLRVTWPQVLYRKKNQIPKFSKFIKQKLLNIICWYNKRFANEIVINDSFNSPFDIHPYRSPDKNDFIELIKQAKGPVHEVMVHPYIFSDELRKVYDASQWKRKKDFVNKACSEYEVLKDLDLKAETELKNTCELVNYSNIRYSDSDKEF